MDELFEQAWTACFRLGRRCGCSATDAEDLAQEVCIKLLAALRRSPARSSTGKPIALAILIGHRTLASWLRGQHHRCKMARLTDVPIHPAPPPEVERAEAHAERWDGFLARARGVGLTSVQVDRLAQALLLWSRSASPGLAHVARVQGLSVANLRRFLAKCAVTLNIYRLGD